MFTLRILDIKVQWQKKILLLKLFEQQHTQVFLNKIFRRLKKGFRIVIYIENIIYYRNSHIVPFRSVGLALQGEFLLSLTSDPEKCAGEPTFIFDSEHFGVLNVEIG